MTNQHGSYFDALNFPEVGIYKRDKKVRKQELDQENKKKKIGNKNSTKKKRKKLSFFS